MRTSTAALFLFCATLLLTTATRAQYFIKNPSYDKRENTHIDIEALRFFPDSLVMDFSYYGDPNVENPGYRINYGTKIELRNLDKVKSYTVSKLVNADFSTYTYVKKKKTEYFSVVFPFSLFDLLIRGDIDANVRNVFTEQKPFNFNFVECTSAYRTTNKIAFGNCFNFSNINVNLPSEQWAVLYCSGYLNSLLAKGEFETTAQFQRRTAPDSLNKLLTTQIDALYDLFSSAYIKSMNDKLDNITYNADREEFTLEYEGADKAVVFVSLAQAPAFKRKVESGDLALSDVKLVRLPGGTHFIEKLIYLDSDTKKTVALENKIKLKSNPKKEFYERVMSDLKRYYTAYRGW